MTVSLFLNDTIINNLVSMISNYCLCALCIGSMSPTENGTVARAVVKASPQPPG